MCYLLRNYLYYPVSLLYLFKIITGERLFSNYFGTTKSAFSLFKVYVFLVFGKDYYIHNFHPFLSLHSLLHDIPTPSQLMHNCINLKTLVFLTFMLWNQNICTVNLWSINYHDCWRLIMSFLLLTT